MIATEYFVKPLVYCGCLLGLKSTISTCSTTEILFGSFPAPRCALKMNCFVYLLLYNATSQLSYTNNVKEFVENNE